MSLLNNQKGQGVVVVIILLVVLGLAGFIGWRVYDQNKPAETNSSESQSSAIEKAEDLDGEIDDLNSQDIDEQLDTSEIDAALE